MKNAFYFILKALFVLKTFWSCRKNGLIRKVRLISKFMASQPGLQTIAITYCPISHKLKATNHTMKFGQLIEYKQNKYFS